MLDFKKTQISIYSIGSSIQIQKKRREDHFSYQQPEAEEKMVKNPLSSSFFFIFQRKKNIKLFSQFPQNLSPTKAFFGLKLCYHVTFINAAYCWVL